MDDGRSVCPTCGAEGTPAARFCSECGAQLEQEPEARKVVTALFADVVGSTALGERLDPEDFQVLIGDGIARIVAVIAQLGGTIQGLPGDGAVALFGAPTAHEDDPERAVLAGLRIVEELAAYAGDVCGRFEIETFAVRVGVETGLAVLGSVGTGSSAGRVAMGDALNTAARLEQAAAPNTVLVGERTRRLVEPLFEWGEPRDLTLKGKSAPVRARQAKAARRGAGRRHSSSAMLVGREHELEVGIRAFERLGQGRGGVLLVTGEAGIGKSRLVAELRARSRAPGAESGPLWLEGRCVSYGEALPYLPFRGLFRDWLGAGPDRPDVEVAELLEQRLDELLGESGGNALALLRPVLGVSPGSGEGAALAALRTEDLQLRSFEAVALLLRRLASERPVVLTLDDVHWADGSSAGLLEHLLPLTGDVPLMVLLAGRPEEDRPAWKVRDHALLHQPERTWEVTLTPLPADQNDELLASLIGADTLPGELAARVSERAEGNPFYLEEIVRSLVDAGALVREATGFRFERDVPIEVPESVEKVILARADRLPRASHEMLGAAAVIGRRFGVSLLEMVFGAGYPLDEALEALQRLDLVHESRSEPEREYRFKHSLIQETVYQSLLRRRRQELHARVGRAIEELFAGRLEERYGLLAHHYRAAGELEAALGYHALAGEKAMGIFAIEEVIEQYTLALDAAAELHLGPKRTARLRLQRARGRGIAADAAGATDDLDAALEGARTTGDRRLEMEVLNELGIARREGPERAIERCEEALAIAKSLRDLPGLAHTHARLSILCSNQLRLREAIDHGRRALDLAEKSGDEGLRGEALDCLKLAALQLGDLDRLAQVSRDLIAYQRGLGNFLILSWALAESAHVPLARGNFDEALRRAEEAVDANRRAGDRSGEPVIRDSLSWVHRSRGHYRLALEAAGRSLEIANHIGAPEWIAWSAATLGWTLLDLQAPDAAARVLRPGLEAAERVGALAQELRCGGLLALAEQLRGEHERAAELADRVEELLERVTVPPGGAFLWGAHAILAVARVRLAEDLFERAEGIAAPLLAAAESAGWRETAAGAALVLGRCREMGGDPAGARELVGRALEVSTSTGFPALAWEAHAILARLHGEAGDRSGAESHAREARTIVEGVAADLDDTELRDSFLRRALAPLEEPAGGRATGE